ncbi:MAG: hypothetical protein KGI11_09240 [Thaumarchaeota archaeon]|nr:hypothetical protein [Nitrososphaerota archaeon]
MIFCAEREDFISKNQTDLFQNVLQSSIFNIRNSLFSNADFAKPSIAKTITREDAATGYTYAIEIPANQRIVILSEKEMILNGSTVDNKGFYHWESGKIFLNQRWVCLETIYHETLHATSLTSVRTDVNQQFLDFYEGLTECYTGYLLLKNHNSCYNNCWRKKSNTACQFTYQPITRVWASFFTCVDMKETFPIYFYDNSTDWESSFDSFISRIREAGNTNFTNILQEPNTKPTWLSFHQECLNQLGSKYESTYNSNRSTIDLIKIIQ